MSDKPLVVIGFLGSSLDAGRGERRWLRWRPSVALCRHSSLPVARLELLYQARFADVCEQVVADIGEVSPETEVGCHLVDLDDPWDFEEVYEVWHRFAREYRFRPSREDYLLHLTTGSHVSQICGFLLTEARYLPARLLQTSPPPKSEKGAPGAYRIIDLDLSKYDRIAQRFAQEQRERLSFLKSGIATKNAAFNQLIEEIEKVAIASADPLLLTGPTGAGKSRLARRIFELKQRRQRLSGTFVDVNCATLRGDAAMSALFGHKKGAFTGAAQARAGYLKKADSGLLFLDEIAELGLDEQAMLLRAIEEKVFFPLGADTETSSDFQLIAGTNRDLRQEVAQGRFREDLLARIDLWTYALPGLTERPEDIEPNLDYELAQGRQSFGVNLTMSREARSTFLDFARTREALWSGNFRDLNGAVRRMATLCEAGRIGKKDVVAELERLRARWSHAGDGGGAGRIMSRVERYLGAEGAAAVDRAERAQLEEVLTVCEGSRSMAHAGKQLFAVSRLERKTRNDSDRVRKYLARFGLAWEDLHPRS